MRSLNSKNVKRRKVAEELLRKAFGKLSDPDISMGSSVGPFQPPPLFIDFIIVGNAIDDDTSTNGIGIGNGSTVITDDDDQGENDGD
jgi:hypothetical protein